MKKKIKTLYHFLPFKKQFFIVLKKCFQPSERVYQHLSFKSTFRVKTGSATSFKIHHYGYMIENEIFWNGIYGGYEKKSLALWAELTKTSDVIFDVGANTGIYSLLAKSINPSASVYAFEPVERVFLKLKANNNLNNYSIKCVQKAASNYNGKATIYDSGNEHIYSVTVNKNLDSNPEATTPIEIDTIKLDSFFDYENIPKIDLIKIDVETHEAQTIEGFKRTIKEYEPTILVEILDNEIAKKIMEIIKGIDYIFINIDENKGFRIVEKLTKSDQYNFLICKKEVANQLNNVLA